MILQPTQTYRLYWLNSTSGQRHPAGVAFYNEDRGDYRLKIDAFPDDKQVFLKPVSMAEGIIQFRLETTVRRFGKLSHRSELGTGYANVGEGYPISIELGPYDRKLLLTEAA